MPPKRSLRKIIDDEATVLCAEGPGLIREEVWVEEDGKVSRYNLAFVNHFMTNKDHGRVLGYDNAHGTPHRHYFGAVETIQAEEYDLISERFLTEVAALRKGTR